MKIILGTFKDNADELAEFLGPRLGAKAEVGGGELNFEDDQVKKTIRSRHVKTYVKRFLNKKGERANYQVQVEGKQLRLIELEHEEEKKEEEQPKLEEKPEAKAAEEQPVQEEPNEEADKEVAAKEEGEATEAKGEEGKDESLKEAATKTQTKPRRKKTD